MAQTVLVADSDRTTLELVTAVLTRDGFEVVATPDGGDALARFFEASPFLVVCAESLSSISGSELCRQIKAQSADTRVVLLHCQAGGIDGLGLAGEIGCDAVLPVPFKYGELKKLLVQWRAVTDEVDDEDPGAFRVPTSEHFKLEMPPPAAPPPEFASGPVAAPTPATATSEAGIPPLPVPIPLPIGGLVQPQDDIPEMDLEDLAPEIPEMELEEVVDEPAPEPTPASVQASAPAEAAPPSAAPTLDVPLEGDLATVPFPRLVYRLYLATFSGVSHLASTAANRSVYIWGGIPVRVDCNQLSESLGRMLLEHGRITIDQYHESMRVMKDKGMRHGEALISIGAITDADLLDALREQTELKVANTFGWREASYRIEPRTDFARDTVLSEVHPLKVIWRGVHEHYDLDSLLQYFIPLQRHYVVGTDLFPVYYDTLGPHLRDLDLPAQLTGKKTVDQVLQGDKRTLQVAQALYVLLVTDMARAEQTPGGAVETPTPYSGAAAAGAPADDETRARLADEIAGEYLRVKESDYLDALRVDTSATAEDVDAAYTNIVSALRLEMMPAGMPDDVLRRAREIKEILGTARGVVRDPAARDRYLLEQQSSFDSGPQLAEAEEDDIPIPQQPESLELAMPAGNAFDAESAYGDGQSLMRQGRFKEAADRFRDAIEAASGEPSFRVALGQALWKAEGQTEAARGHVVTCLQQALQLDPSHIDANLEMARLLIESGNTERAYAYVQRVLQRHSSHPEARRLLASLG